MSAQMQGQQPDISQKRKESQKSFPWKLALVLIIFFAALAILAVWILSILSVLPSYWAAVLYAVLTVVGIVTPIAVLVITRAKPEPLATAPSAPAQQTPAFSPQPLVVQVQYPPSPQLVPLPVPPSQPPVPDNGTYRDIVGLPPPTDVKAIQQREQAVEEIYTQLSQPDVTALVLTGIGGAGKSTLAALVYEYTEKQRPKGAGIFQDTPVWLAVNESVTMADLAGTLSEVLGKSIPDVGNLPPARQAVALFNALNTVDKPRLIVIDQFENLLDWQTGHALAERPGVGEWLDALNSRQSHCRILLTSRPWPQGTRAYPATRMQQYHVGSMTIPEGIELLRKQGITSTDDELSKAVKRCEGHPFALILLASLLRNHNLSLSTMFKEPVHPMYAQLWSGDIAHNLLDLIFAKQLNETQSSLLLAFSIYREAVPLDAAQALLSETPDIPRVQTQDALNVLLAQHLLNALGEGRYLLHAIVTNYAQDHFNERDEQANQNALRAGHAKAAQYYQQQAAKICPPRPQRKRISDVYPFIEAVWHLCRAAQWQAAYDTLEQEYLFNDLNRWGGNAILLEIYQLLEPSDEWHPQSAQEAYIYVCLGFVYDDLGKQEEARKYYEQALAINRAVGNRSGEGTTLNNLGKVYNALGKKEEALKYYEQALAIEREVGDRGVEGITLHNIGTLYFAKADYPVALACFLLARSIFEEVQSPNRDVVQSWIDDFGREIGEEQFASLLAQVEPQAGQIVEQLMHRDDSEGL